MQLVPLAGFVRWTIALVGLPPPTGKPTEAQKLLAGESPHARDVIQIGDPPLMRFSLARPLLPGLMLLISVGAARAAIIEVSPTGTGSGAPGSPTTMANANAIVKAGDVVRILPGTYPTAPDPATSGTAGARITYVGNLANPNQVVITPDMTIKRKYISIKGLSFGGSVGFDRLSSSPGACAQFDSLAYANVYNSFGMDQAKDCMAYMVNVTSGLGRFSMSTPAAPPYQWTTPERDTVRRCTFNVGQAVTDGYHVVQIRGATNCVIDSNRVYIQMYPNLVNEVDPFIAFFMRYCELKDNRWQVLNTGGQGHMFRWRDSTQFNRVYRDSVILQGSGYCRFAPSSAGTFVGTTTQNYFKGLYVKSSTDPSDYALYYQNGMRRDTLLNCIVIDSLGKAFTNGQVEQGTSLVDHCTFVGNSSWGVSEMRCGVNQWGAMWSADGQMVFTNNLMYQLLPGGAGTEEGMGWNFSTATDQLTSNGNLYFMAGKSAGRAIGYTIQGQNTVFVPPGPGTSWATTYGRDANSYWGSPRFVDSTFTNFDPRPGPGSFAAGRALDGTDIGALAAAGPDLVAPGTVANLNATEIYDNKAWLTWSSPGDDGSTGLAAAYDLRYSTTPITSTSFATATAVSPQPVPLVAGSAQSYLALNLTPGTTYYFAIKTRDEAGNWSGLSNVRTVATTASDAKSPAAVKDLTAAP